MHGGLNFVSLFVICRDLHPVAELAPSNDCAGAQWGHSSTHAMRAARAHAITIDPRPHLPLPPQGHRRLFERLGRTTARRQRLIPPAADCRSDGTREGDPSNRGKSGGGAGRGVPPGFRGTGARGRGSGGWGARDPDPGGGGRGPGAGRPRPGGVGEWEWAVSPLRGRAMGTRVQEGQGLAQRGQRVQVHLVAGRGCRAVRNPGHPKQASPRGKILVTP